MRNLKNTLGGALLAFAILFGIGIASSTTAQAQYRNDDYYRRQQREQERLQRQRQREYEREQRRRQREAARNGGYYGNNGGYGNGGYNNDGYGNYGGGSYELRQTALNAGYNEGNKEGRNDRNRRDQFNYTDEGAYQNASKDYNSRFGNRSLYQQYFRQAFVNGYTDGYRGY